MNSFHCMIPEAYRFADVLASGIPLSAFRNLPPMSTDFGKRLKTARKHAGLIQAQLAKAVGIGQSTVAELEKEGFGSSHVATIAAACGVSPIWLATGEGPMLPGAVATAMAIHTADLAPAPAPGMPAIRVPLLANAGSMGLGTEIQHDDVLVGHIALSEQWVSRRLQPTSPAALRFIHAYGDSMHPTFEDGDVLLVDTGMRDPKAIDGVYVMAANDRVYIKRVRQRMDGVVEISSDNPTVKTVDVLNGDHSIDVLGRVVWCWNGRKL